MIDAAIAEEREAIVRLLTNEVGKLACMQHYGQADYWERVVDTIRARGKSPE